MVANSKLLANSNIAAKLAVRYWALDRVGGVKKANVLELFGGAGEMYDRCYRDVHTHLAFDLKPSDRPTWIQGDNRKLLPQHVQGKNLYDADSYANPWAITRDVVRLRDKGRFALVVTCGLGCTLFFGKPGKFLRVYAGFNKLPDSFLYFRWYFDLVNILIHGWREFGVEVEEARYAKTKPADYMKYMAFVVVKS